MLGRLGCAYPNWANPDAANYQGPNAIGPHLHGRKLMEVFEDDPDTDQLLSFEDQEASNTRLSVDTVVCRRFLH
jgi:hypothetical protein